ncbi:methyl-accepting chemotaxis protein [Vreelandella alkaliphila]|uniref:Methyl-accepting chemotaxis protein n=1 Tax=Vreelandella alkaliphila TaxID=272774 RepID=A0ABX4HE88_9GAMM|nr:methyl-accepting chemotaxis protein [Halomonas humidisoli]PAU70723.1 methyl-accepting chemotaxis protein [Halomonas humidisoli]
MRVTPLLRQMMSNMTVRLSWGLVLATFSMLVVVACGIGLYALHHGAAIVQASSDLQAQQAAFSEFATRIRWVLIGVVIMTGITVAVVVWGVTVNVLRPLDRLVGYFEKMAQGDLSQQITSPGNNEIGRLYTAMAHMQSSLSETVGVVRQSGASIFERSQHIASGNNDLSSRTEQQASSLEETASSMEQLASTVGHNADNALQASQLANEVTLTARRSGEEVANIVETMQDISASSHQVADIITVIDNIAFQTNILALNASVEAARAGEHGKGFAVVAQEVRSLASRSANAAKEIRTLIDASLGKVDAGTQRVNHAGKTMQDLVAAVQRVNDIMDEIAAASEEQSNGIGQVNQAVAQMDQVVQQNAQLVQQAARSANELESEAARLREAVERFHVTPALAEGKQESGYAMRPRALQQVPAAQTPAAKKIPARNMAVDEWEAF